MSEDEFFRGLMDRMFPQPRDPRWRYIKTKDGTLFMWTTERMGDGKFASAILKPTERDPKGRVTGWRTVREVHHRLRQDAKARAFRLHKQATEATEEK